MAPLTFIKWVESFLATLIGAVVVAETDVITTATINVAIAYDQHLQQ
jgi:hypothetical protein